MPLKVLAGPNFSSLPWNSGSNTLTVGSTPTAPSPPFFSAGRGCASHFFDSMGLTDSRARRPQRLTDSRARRPRHLTDSCARRPRRLTDSRARRPRHLTESRARRPRHLKGSRARRTSLTLRPNEFARFFLAPRASGSDSTLIRRLVERFHADPAACGSIPRAFPTVRPRPGVRWLRAERLDGPRWPSLPFARGLDGPSYPTGTLA